jgi:hypothetical protein
MGKLSKSQLVYKLARKSFDECDLDKDGGCCRRLPRLPARAHHAPLCCAAGSFACPGLLSLLVLFLLAASPGHSLWRKPIPISFLKCGLMAASLAAWLRGKPVLPASTVSCCVLASAGSIDVKELHVGLLLVYDKLNKASHPCLLGLSRAGLVLPGCAGQSPACPQPIARDASSLHA